MATYYELSAADFIQFLLNCVQDSNTGIVFFFSSSADWGKIVINKGQIQSVRFKNFRGNDALPGIQELELVQYQFRTEESVKLAPTQDKDIDNEAFFNYFGVTLSTNVPASLDNNADVVVGHSEHKEAATKHRNQAKILIADDSPTARKALSRILLEAGYQVVEARNGFETLGQLENERPDLLLLDLIMPGIDGYSVIKTIERTKGANRIPIVVLTSRDSLLDKIKSMSLSCDAYITKPVQANVLLEIANKYLPNFNL